MTLMTARDFEPKLLELYDFYAHGIIMSESFWTARPYLRWRPTATTIWAS